MRRLIPLRTDPLAVFDSLVQQKEEPRRSRLVNLRPQLAGAYCRYYLHAPSLEQQQPLGRRVSTKEGKDLRDCYIRANALKARVHELSYYCAYCGLHVANTIDHYLPKGGSGGFPELSVLPVNLLPSCSHCNTPRDFRDNRGRRALIHPYFDRVPNARLLFAEVTIRQGLPDARFRVKVRDCPDHAFGALFARHVRLLRLRQRYRAHAMSPNGPLENTRRTIQCWGAGRGDASRCVLEQARLYERECGANHFNTALWFGAAESTEFIEFCLEVRK